MILIPSTEVYSITKYVGMSRLYDLAVRKDLRQEINGYK